MTALFGPQGSNAATTLPNGSTEQRYGTQQTWVQDCTAPGRNDGSVLNAAFYNRIIGNLDYLISASGITANPGDMTAVYRAILGAVATGAPDALNSLQELANALGDDPNFSTTILTALTQRLRVDTVQSLTSTQKTQAVANLGLAPVAVSGAYADLSGKPTLATVATSGAYSDLTGKPPILFSPSPAVDFNTLTTTGSYQTVDVSSTNAPLAGFGWIIEVFQNISGYVIQRATETATGSFVSYYRAYTGTWQPWLRIVSLDSSGKLPAYDGSQLTNLPSSTALGGQCYLSLSGSNLLLAPKRGNQLYVNGQNRTIPAAGVTLAPGTITVTSGVGGGPMQYIYAAWSGTAITLEMSTTSHATDTSSGMEVKSGDATRTLVGIWCASGTNTWSTIATEGASWFNPEEKAANSGVNNPSTTATTLGFIPFAIPQPFVTFAGRNVRYSTGATMVQTVATASMLLDLGLDSTGTSGQLIAPISAQGSTTSDVVSCFRTTNKSFAEGRHTLCPIGATSTGQTTYDSLFTEVTIFG